MADDGAAGTAVLFGGINRHGRPARRYLDLGV